MRKNLIFLTICLFLITNYSHSTTRNIKVTNLKQEKTDTPVNKLDLNWVAKVNGEIINYSTYKRALDVATKELSAVSLEQISPTANPQKNINTPGFKRKILDGLVNNILIIQGSKMLGVEAEEKEISQKMKSIMKGFPNESTFYAALAEENILPNEYKDGIIKQILIQKISKKLINDEEITTSDIQSYYLTNPTMFKEEYLIEANLIKNTDSNLLKELKTKIDNGENFAELAKKYSTHESSKKGGLVNEDELSEIGNDLIKKVVYIDENTNCSLIQINDDYYLIKLNKKVKNPEIKFGLVQDKIKDFLIKRRGETLFDSWLNDWKKSSFIEINEKYFEKDPDQNKKTPPPKIIEGELIG